MRGSVSPAAVAGAGDEAGDDADDEDEADEDERAGPGQGVLLLERTGGIDEDLERKGGDRLVERRRPELVAERGEEERRGLAGDAGDGDERTGDDPRHRRAQDDR